MFNRAFNNIATLFVFTTVLAACGGSNNDNGGDRVATPQLTTEVQTNIQQVVEEAFDAKTDKAGISVAVYTGSEDWQFAKGEAAEGRGVHHQYPICFLQHD